MLVDLQFKLNTVLQSGRAVTQLVKQLATSEMSQVRIPVWAKTIFHRTTVSTLELVSLGPAKVKVARKAMANYLRVPYARTIKILFWVSRCLDHPWDLLDIIRFYRQFLRSLFTYDSVSLPFFVFQRVQDVKVHSGE
ncbi:hypothetical protein PoB_005298300 [Plakobranchus ocellatus]|uniref:Uncharacterized protein n=1 Tax=Plakobranchus ocellatus TaxID=259542 RepID=A0AAV4C4Z6_9GAST|nr:hypothetical protein PoB_005298300 [Plakobranchus ocellatus]